MGTELVPIPKDIDAMKKGLARNCRILSEKFKDNPDVCFDFDDNPPRIYVVYNFDPRLRGKPENFPGGEKVFKSEWKRFGELVIKVNHAMVGEKKIVRGKRIISHPLQNPFSGDLYDGHQIATAWGYNDSDFPVRKDFLRYGVIQGL